MPQYSKKGVQLKVNQDGKPKNLAQPLWNSTFSLTRKKLKKYKNVGESC